MKTAIFMIMTICVMAYQRDLENMASKVNSMNTTWKANENTISRDYRKLIGIIPSSKRLHRRHYSVKVKELPEAFDLTVAYPECTVISHIRDQSSCGSCWAVAAAGAASDRVCVASKGKINKMLSSEDMLSCCEFCMDGCHGGNPVLAWMYLNTDGISTGGDYNTTQWCKSYPWEECSHWDIGDKPACTDDTPHVPLCEKACQKGYSISYAEDKQMFDQGYEVEPGELNFMKEIYEHGSIEIIAMIYEDFLTYKSGVYQHVTGECYGSHAMRIIGWGVEDGVKYWRVANSWNEQWGDHGFVKVIRGTDECGIESMGYGGIPILK